MRLLFSLTVFISAFLLFFVQPLLAKRLLPAFGGSSFVWIASILFFQLGLLLGYTYAALLVKFFSDRQQAIIHFILLGVSFYFIPLSLEPTIIVNTPWPPLTVISLLTSSALLPFMMISASSPLLQQWYCQICRTEFPYFYYAISNFGSLLGLLGYPLLLEPLWGLRFQMKAWSLLYAIYALLCIMCLVPLFKLQQKPQTVASHTKVIQVIPWLGLTFLSSTLLLSITQFLTQNVINMPLIWVLPLALYLISYIVVFSKDKKYDREFWSASFLIWLALATMLIYFNQQNGWQAVIVVLSLLYCACMICHGELIRLKPQQKDLTLFYLFIALGGVLGGIFVNIVALGFFKDRWDFYIPILIVNGFVMLITLKIYQKTLKKWDFGVALLSVCTAMVWILVTCFHFYAQKNTLIAQYRNTYGLIRIYDIDYQDSTKNIRILMHGTIMHGLQFKGDNKKLLPTTYYGRGSGVWLAAEFLHQHHQPLHMGVIGLGAGTLAAIGKKHERITFYEIDKDVKEIALQDFSYLTDSPAETQVILGDARIQLQKELMAQGSRQYNLLVIDAFNGDATPFHLITKEAMQLYMAHLAKNGILAFNISNNYVDFLPVTTALANAQGCQLYWVKNGSDEETAVTRSMWVLISCNAQLGPWLAQQKIQWGTDKYVIPYLWTDDFNSVLPLLK